MGSINALTFYKIITKYNVSLILSILPYHFYIFLFVLMWTLEKAELKAKSAKNPFRRRGGNNLSLWEVPHEQLWLELPGRKKKRQKKKQTKKYEQKQEQKQKRKKKLIKITTRSKNKEAENFQVFFSTRFYSCREFGQNWNKGCLKASETLPGVIPSCVNAESLNKEIISLGKTCQKYLRVL